MVKPFLHMVEIWWMGKPFLQRVQIYCMIKLFLAPMCTVDMNDMHACTLPLRPARQSMLPLAHDSYLLRICTHGTLLHNLASIYRCLSLNCWDDKMSWEPFYVAAWPEASGNKAHSSLSISALLKTSLSQTYPLAGHRRFLIMSLNRLSQLIYPNLIVRNSELAPEWSIQQISVR